MPTPPPKRWNVHLLIGAVLVLITFSIFLPVRSFDFVQYDDPDYSLNPQVQNGITTDSLRWAVTTGEASNWFPLTRISLLLDAQLFGQHSGPQHLVNAALHAFAALLLFAFLVRATSATWPSAFAALFFAVHPLRVESVAWLAERKDVLSAFFWFLTLLAYIRYVERPRTQRYALVLLAFALGLMSKPMLVTLPFVLILLDVWPLKRLSKSTIVEKLPFFALSIAAATIAYLTQKSGGATSMLHIAADIRIENAIVTYVTYILQMFWPGNLAVLYPYPAAIPFWQPLAATILLGGITAIALLRFRDLPYLAIGWFWYLGTLVPVIGLIQIGYQSHADRYTYIPTVGLLVMLCWGTADLIRRIPSSKPYAIAAAALAGIAMIVVTENQLPYWQSSEPLYRHAIAVSPPNPLMHYDLAVVLEKMPGRATEAIDEYRAAIAINPDQARARSNLAILLESVPGSLPEAIEQYQAALKLDPQSATVRNNLGVALVKAGRKPEATAQFEEALRLQPSYEEYKNLADLLATNPERLNDAAANYEAALRLKPNSVEAHNNLAGVFQRMSGRLQDAISHYQAALRIQPNSAALHNNLGAALQRDPNRTADAIAQYEAALRIKPEYLDANYNLGVLLANMPGRSADARTHLETVVRARPDPELQKFIDRLKHKS